MSIYNGFLVFVSWEASAGRQQPPHLLQASKSSILCQRLVNLKAGIRLWNHLSEPNDV